MRHNPGHGIMHRLMPARGVVAVGVAERLKGRELDTVFARHIECLRPAMRHARVDRLEPLVDLRHTLECGKGRGLDRRGGEPLGQALDLRDVEHGIGFEETHLARVVAAGALGPVLARRGAAVIDDRRTLLAAFDLSPQNLRLLVGHPSRRLVACR